MKTSKSIPTGTALLAGMVLGVILTGASGALSAEKRIKVSGNSQIAKCKACPRPEYPKFARDVRVQGVVTLYVIIDKEGKVAEVKLISGHPLLSDSAQKAVETWRYEPTLSEGALVEVETEVAIRFDLKN